MRNQVTRRTFLRGSLLAASGFGLVAMSGCQPNTTSTANVTSAALVEVDPLVAGVDEGDVVCSTMCRANCYQACKLEAHVRDGKVTRISPRYFEGDLALYRGGCLKGISLAARTYSSKRLKHPLRRVGERGAGEWERITWDEAIEDMAKNLGRIREQYGDRAIALDICSGNGGLVNSFAIMGRWANATGMTYFADSNDHAIGYGSDRVMGCGIWENGNEIRAILSSKLIIIWGSNLVHSHIQDWRWVSQAKQNGARLICIDPQFSNTAARCDEYIPIEPGTDPLLALGLLRTIIENEWCDIDYMADQTNAFQLVRTDNGKILKNSDLDSSISVENIERCVWDNDINAPVAASQAKNPELEGTFTVDGIELSTCFTMLKNRAFEYDYDFITEKTKIAKDTIIDLADRYAHSEASGIYFGYGPNMYTNGHLTSQAFTTMASITGQMGEEGKGLYGLFNRGSISGGSGSAESVGGKQASINHAFITDPENGKASFGDIPKTEMYNVFRTQTFRGEDYPLKALMTFAANAFSNQCGQSSWISDVLPNLEYWVVADIDVTDSTDYADLVLPVSHWLEYEDAYYDYATPFLGLQEKCIDPMYESKPDHEIITLLAKEMGLEECFPEVETEYWLHGALDVDGLKDMGISFDNLRENKVMQVTPPGDPWVRGKTFPWATDDNLLHIYCEDPAPAMDYGQDWQSFYEREHLPYWREATEVYPDNPDRERFPLVFLTDRSRFRTHTQFSNLPTLREIDPEPYIRMNPQDASDRELGTDDIAEVYNDRGHVVAKVRVDNGVRSGCIAMPKGWQRYQFIEGGYQEITQPKSDVFINNFCYYDALCEVRKFEEVSS